MDPIAMSICLFKGAVGLVWMILRKRTLEELRKGGDLADKEYRRLILTEVDKISLKLDRQSRKELNTSKSFYKEGLAHLNEVLTNANIKKRDTYTAETAKRYGLVGQSTFYAANDLNESAKEALSQAKEAFVQAHIIATNAFNDGNLDVEERIEAMHIRLMAKIFQNMEYPSNILPSCSHYLEEMHKLPKIKTIFRDAVAKGKKPPFSKEEDMSIFVGVCHIHRIIYDVTQLSHQRIGPWTWPCIQVEVDKMIHQIDPLRDVRVAELHWKLQKEETENVLTSTSDLPVVWSFGSEKDLKLISPRDIATNTKGELIVADNGDRTIKLFDESGTFLYSFSPLSRHLADEDILSVTTDRENNIFVLIKKDKYRYELHLFDRHGKLYHRFPLSEGHVRCSPIINNNEVLVVIEGKDTERSAVQVYKTDGEFVKSFGQEILDLKEPKDMTVANEDHLMILNSDGSVIVFDTERNHHQELDFNHADGNRLEAIAFHSNSKHVVISELGCRVKMSIYNERRQCVHSIYQGDETGETMKTERVPPKIAVTIDGRIAILAGIVGESKVIVV